MGIKNLQKFFDQHLTDPNCIKTIHTSTLIDKVIVLDSSIFLYQYICAIRKSSSDIYSVDGQIITHIQATLSKVFSLIKNKIKPIFVFDGKAPEMKKNVLSCRADKKNLANDDVVVLKRKIKDLSKKLKKEPETMEDIENLTTQFSEYVELTKQLKQSLKIGTSITRSQTKECKKLLKLMGIPCFQAPNEADPFCAELVKSDIGYAVSSEDMDLLTFGTKILIRKLKSSGTCVHYDLNLIIKNLKITYAQFIDICILLGCDYTSTIRGLGIKSILREIKTHKNIEGIIKSNHYIVPEDFDYIGARNEFNKKIDVPDNCTWNKPDYEYLSRFLREKFAFSEDEIEKINNFLRTSYYSVICGEKKIKQYEKDCRTFVNEKRKNITMDSDED